MEVGNTPDRQKRLPQKNIVRYFCGRRFYCFLSLRVTAGNSSIMFRKGKKSHKGYRFLQKKLL